jgi:hypothetical protein
MTKKEQKLHDELVKCSDVLAMLHNAGAITTKMILAGSQGKGGMVWSREAVESAQKVIKEVKAS